jgi:hypothetical protein
MEESIYYRSIRNVNIELIGCSIEFNFDENMIFIYKEDGEGMELGEKELSNFILEYLKENF